MRYCPYCMREIEGSWCPDCQKDVETASNGTNLAIGTILDTHYVIGICLGAGGFGVTYLARDQHLGRIVAIKEYFPSCWAYRRKRTQEVCAFPDQQLAYERGKQQFLTEGQLLVEVEDLPHIVDVYDSFEENGTSYLVMRYLEGKTLEELTLDEFKQYSDLFAEDVYTAIDLTTCCEGRTSYGGPSEASVNNQIALANAQLDAWEEKNA